MSARRRRATGIDISPGRIAAAWVEKAGGAYRVIHSAAVSRARLESASDDAGLSRALRKLGMYARRRSGKAAISISSDRVLMRMIDMPEHIPSNMNEFIEADLKQCVALSGRNTVSDFCGIVGSSRLLAVATDVDEIRADIKACAAAGISVEIVEPSVLALARAIDAPGESRRRQCSLVVAELSETALAVCVFRHGSLDFVRARNVPGGTASQFGLEEWLGAELHAVVQYYNAKSPDGRTEWDIRMLTRGIPISVDGTQASCPEIATLTVIDTASLPETDGSEKTVEPSVVARGLAMRLLAEEEDAKEINLLPSDVAQKRSVVALAVMMAGVSVIAMLIALAAISILAGSAEEMSQKISQVERIRRPETASVLLFDERRLDEQIAAVQSGVDSLRTVIDGQADIHWASVLTAVARSTTRDVCITKLMKRDQGSLIVHGFAASGDAARIFAKALQREPALESASLVRVEKSKAYAGLVQYEMTCLLMSK